MNWKPLVKSAAAIAVGGAAASVHQYLAAGKLNYTELGHVAGIGALTAITAYLLPAPHQADPPPVTTQLDVHTDPVPLPPQTNG